MTPCLYTTMDVTFLESEMYFCTRDTHSLLQGEKLNEDQNWVLENWMTWGSKRTTDEHERDSKGHKDSKGERASEHITEH